MTLLDTALRYAAIGWPVFRCRPGTKVPLIPNPHDPGSPERRTCRGECGLLGHGVLDATTDPAVVRRWWTATPAANIGIACGAPGPDVVDIDCKHGAPGPATFGRLRDAGLLRGAHAVVVTPSGGWHLFYAGTSQGNSTRARHGVDFRSRGGYVLAPPSTVDGQSYRLAEHRQATGETIDWSRICTYLDPPRPPRAHTPATGPAQTLDGLARWVAGQREGNRNSGLYWAARRAMDAGASGADLRALVDAGLAAGLSEREAFATVESAQKAVAA